MSDRGSWRGFSERLDQVLELPPAEQAAWLERLARSEPETARRIGEVLAGAPAMEAASFLVATAAVSLPPSLIGAQIGPWTIEAEIGRGGMSSVWRARRSDGSYDGLAAIKFVSLATLGGEGEQRFRREGRLLARLDHPHIARLLDAGLYGATHQPYLLLEYIDGVAIDEHCASRALGLEARIGLFLRVLDAVAHAHGQLIVHRDLKPANILVAHDGTVKLLDFGIARLVQSDEATTRSVVSALTPQYAAPEQVLGLPVTVRTDVYALGLVLYRLLTGSHAVPSLADSSAERWHAVVTAEPPLSSTVSPGIPAIRARLAGDLDNILRKALRKTADERYPTAAAFADDLGRYLRNEPVTAQPDTLTYRSSKFVRRHRAGVAAALAISAALIGTTVFAFMQMLEADRQRAVAKLEAEDAQARADFMDQVLTQVADAGEPLTHDVLLGRSVEFARKRFADQPRVLVGTLIHLSGRYMNRGDTAAELATLETAAEIARRSGDPRLVARVECNTVESELARGRRDLARTRLERGMASLARVESPDARQQFECLNAAASLAEAAGDQEAAIAAVARGAQALEAAGDTGSILYVSATSHLATLHDWVGRYAAGLEWAERGTTALEEAGLAGTESMAWLLFNRSQLLGSAGQWADALAVQREVVTRLSGQAPIAGAHPRAPRWLGRCLDPCAPERQYHGASACSCRRPARRLAGGVAYGQLDLWHGGPGSLAWGGNAVLPWVAAPR